MPTKTVARYVEARESGGNPFVHVRRPRLIDPFVEKVEELVDRSKAEVRADVVHDRIVAMGFAGDERTTSLDRSREFGGRVGSSR